MHKGLICSFFKFFYVMCLFFTTTATTCRANLYESVTRENLKSFANVQVPWPKFNHKKEFYEILYDRLKMQLNPHELVKRRSVFNLLCQKNPVLSDVMDEKTWMDLEVLCGPKSDPTCYLASKIDRTYTQMGKAALFCKIVNPSCNGEQLENQQRIIRELVENTALFDQLDKQLKELVVPENAMLSFWTEDLFQSQIKQNEIKIPLLKGLESWLNQNEMALELNDRCSIFNVGLMVFVRTIGAITLPLYGLSLFTNRSWADLLKNFNSRYLALGAQSLYYMPIGTICYLMTWYANNKWTEGSAELVSGVSCGQQSWDMRSRIRGMVALGRCLHTKLVHVATYLRSMKNMIATVKANHVIHTLMPAIGNFDDKLASLEQTSKDVKRLLSLLETRTFKDDASMFSYAGRSILTYKLMHALKDQFIDAMMVVGEIDANLSCAKLFKEFEGKRVSFCFPIYVHHAEAPSMYVQDAWNPFISPDVVVANSLAIGSVYRTPQSVIISGPNAGGKSTITKSFVIGIILAQSLGIAPAKQLTFTPFKKIVTYLNITDDIAAGNSHFKAGVMRARDVVDVVKSTKEEGFSLTVLDEVFNGTTFKEGQAAAYSLIKMLGQSANNICITNTHFPIIPKLEAETGLFKNYKVCVVYGEGDKMHYPFRLEPGISDQVVTLKILQEEGFGDDFLAVAQGILD